MLSKDLENALNELFRECSENLQEFVTIEHLLLVLTKEESSRKIFEHLSVDIASLEKEIKEYIKGIKDLVNSGIQRKWNLLRMRNVNSGGRAKGAPRKGGKHGRKWAYIVHPSKAN